MKNTVFFFFIILITLSIWACEEEDDFVINDPTIKAVFYNMSRLIEVEDTLSIVNDSLEVLSDTLTYYSDSADVVTDSILSLELAILTEEDQDSFDSLRLVEYVAESMRLIDIYSGFDSLDSILSDSYTYWTAVSTSINNGEVVVSSITNENNGQVIAYEDTASSWYIPLDMNSDTTNLSLVLGDESYELGIIYSRLVDSNEFGEVLIDAFGFNENKITSTFDSLELNCETTNCLNGATSISIYF